MGDYARLRALALTLIEVQYPISKVRSVFTFRTLTGCEPESNNHRVVRSDLAGSTQPRSPGKMKTTMEQVKTKSVEPHTRFALPEVNWDELNEPGAYVERGSGDLYRVPKEAIIPGGSPIIHKESAGSSRLVQVSKNPFVTTLEARLRCAQHNIDPNF